MGVERVIPTSRNLDESYMLSGDNSPVNVLRYVQGKRRVRYGLSVDFADKFSIEFVERPGKSGIEATLYLYSCTVNCPGSPADKLKDLDEDSLSAIRGGLSPDAKKFWDRCSEEYGFSNLQAAAPLTQ